jgi:hypothetical protein
MTETNIIGVGGLYRDGGLNLKTIELEYITPAPWRFSENKKFNHGTTRFYSPIQHNIEVSLMRDGQFAPIHVWSPEGRVFEMIDGHIVMDAARTVGLKTLVAIDHGTIGTEQAMLRYIMLNLNRCGQYGHYHVKIHRVFGQLWPGTDTATKTARLAEYLSWPVDRVQDYVELSERDTNWEKFMFIPKDDGEQTGFFDSTEPAPAPDYQ